MFITKIRAAAAGIVAAGVMGGTGLTGVASAQNAPVYGCAFQTYNGHYVTAVGGGGRVTDVLHTDATAIRGWEKFTLIDSGDGSPIHYGIKTYNGHYLTALGGGGYTTDPLHSDATQLLGWEKFTLVPLGGDWYAIQTSNGHYLTANGGGGRITNVMRSDATTVQGWEEFRVTCGH